MCCDAVRKTGSSGIDYRWSCDACKTEQMMDGIDYVLLQRERNKKIMMVKLKYNRLLSKF